MKRLARSIGMALLAMTITSPLAANEADSDYLARPDVNQFIASLAAHDGFDRQQLERLFGSIERQSRVLEVIKTPAEAKPWYQYRKIFITPRRVSGGVAFWDQNQTALKRAQERFGVPAAIIVAIIGVETYYGRQTGGFPVFDTLATLGFDYPPRARFFRSELKQFLLLSREESLDVRDVEGSYAGAMGKGQFIPSSYREYAIDFDNDGRRDLWRSDADAIGSVGNYFHRHGWRPGGPVALPARVDGKAFSELLDRGLEPSIDPASLAAHGVTPNRGNVHGGKAALFAYDTGHGADYWLGLHNFYVITRYNHSSLYALAVYQLSRAIKQARAGAVAQK